MVRSLSFVAVGLMALVLCAPGRAQDTPSLGDLARQAQKNKVKTPAKKVFTNDDLSSGSSSDNGPGPSSAGATSATNAPTADGKSGEAPTPDQALEHMTGVINQMDPLDRAALAKMALEGVDKDFPGRSEWEEKLFAAKQTYVAQGRDFVRKAKAMQANAGPAKGVEDPNDPAAKAQADQVQTVVQYGARIEAAFQDVITEGRDLAGKASAH